MISICVGCEQMFQGEINRVYAKELPSVKCEFPEDYPDMCLNPGCTFYVDEEDYYGCTDFALCDQCLADKKVIKEVLKNYKNMYFL